MLHYVWTTRSRCRLDLVVGESFEFIPIVPFCSTLKTQKQYPPAQHPISAFSSPRHNETSFHKQGAFHESFITKPLALFPNKPFCGSKLRLIQFSLGGAIVSSTTKRLSCHQANCQYRSCMLPQRRPYQMQVCAFPAY
jgi:hypothetical protein